MFKSYFSLSSTVCFRICQNTLVLGYIKGGRVKSLELRPVTGREERSEEPDCQKAEVFRQKSSTLQERRREP